MYNNIKALNVIKAEKINVMSFQYTPGGAVKNVYICTLKGTELDLGNAFVSKYTIDEDWDIRSAKTSTGFSSKTCAYKITEKETNTVVYEQ